MERWRFGLCEDKYPMYQHAIKSEDLPWTQLDFPGVSMRIVHQNPATGVMTVLTRLDPAARIPAHRHSRADESVFVLSGDFVEAGVTYGPGTLFLGAAGTPHGPHQSNTGCTVLTTFSAPLDFELV
jgi:quercetin dioxygenase-like cupin family protein